MERMSRLVEGVGVWQVVVGVVVAVAVQWVLQRWVAYARNRRQLARVGPGVVVVGQAFGYASLPALLLPRSWGWVRGVLPYMWTDLHTPLDLLFRRTRCKAVAFVASDHAELFIK